MNIQNDVRNFHVKFSQTVNPQPTTDVRDHIVDFRIERISEECDELLEAIRQRNLAAIAQEGVDLIYVVIGTFVIFGLPFARCWAAVQKANMAKEPAPGNSEAHPLKPLKPHGWLSPKHIIQQIIGGR